MPPTRYATAWVAILTIPMVGSGLYGMNFEHTPGLASPYGFWIFLAVVLIFCTALWVFFRHRKWL